MSILHKVTRQIFEKDQGLIDYRKFVQMRQHEGFTAYLHKYLQLYVGLLLEDMLSERFTKLNATEKDIQQRAYKMVHEIITWIMQPEIEATKLNLIRQHNQKMAAYLKEGKPEKEKQNGRTAKG